MPPPRYSIWWRVRVTGTPRDRWTRWKAEESVETMLQLYRPIIEGLERIRCGREDYYLGFRVGNLEYRLKRRKG